MMKYQIKLVDRTAMQVRNGLLRDETRRVDFVQYKSKIYKRITTGRHFEIYKEIVFVQLDDSGQEKS